jgi:diacylglycerol O-acyltransferase
MQSMSTLDSLFLHVENEVSHMHLGAVALFDGPAPTEGELAELVAGRLALLARYRQRVRLVPGGLGRPLWVEDPHFQLGHHLRHTALPRPGDAAQLRQLVGRVMAQPLDRRRPLWEMWLFEGADADRWGLICKLHHCMVDGIAAGDLLGVLLSPEPRTPPSVPDDWQPGPEPSSASVLAHTLGEYASGASQHVRTARALLSAPGHTARRAATLTGGLTSLRGPAGAPAARSLNGPLRAERQWVQARGRLEDVKTIRRALGGTVNDVLLAAVSGGFRALLQQRGEPLPHELIVRTLVPLSLRTPDARGIPDNRVSALIAELPIGLKDPVERLHAITIQLDALKRSRHAVAASTLTALSGLAPPSLLALGARALARAPQRRLQTVTTNIPGPQQPLYLCGRRMLEIFPYVPLALSVRIGVAICSYDGTLGFGVTGDGQHATDIPTLAGGIEHELAQLLDRATPTASAGTPNAKPGASSNAISATSTTAASPAPTRPETRRAGVRSAADGRPPGARRSSRPPRGTAGRRTRTASPSRNPGSPPPLDASPGSSTPGDVAGADRGAELAGTAARHVP